MHTIDGYSSDIAKSPTVLTVVLKGDVKIETLYQQLVETLELYVVILQWIVLCTYKHGQWSGQYTKGMHTNIYSDNDCEAKDPRMIL